MMHVRLAALTLALLFCLPGACSAETSSGAFALMDGLTWATTPQEAVERLGEGTEFQEDADEDIGKLGLVVRDGLKFGGLDCGRIALIYYNDAMVYATLYFSEESLGGDIGALIAAESAALGDPAYVGAAQQDDLPEALGSMQVSCRWTPDEQTQVSVLRITEPDYPYFCALFFENLPVEELLEIAMSVE